jgi:hypothetical protein
MDSLFNSKGYLPAVTHGGRSSTEFNDSSAIRDGIFHPLLLEG